MKRSTMFSKVVAILMVLLLSLSVTACSSSEKLSEDVYTGGDNYGAVADEYLESGDVENSSGSSLTKEESVKNNRKIIETITYSVQTKTFDDFVKKLEDNAAELGGYIESSDISGNTYEDNSPRYASYVFRVPSDKVDAFTITVSENSTVTNKSVNTEDVTLQYVDIESRLTALENEKAALEELLKDAKSTSDIIEIRDMLTEVIYEIESNKSQLRTYDSLIDFTSITVDIHETEHPQVVEKQTVWQEIASNLSENFRGVWNFIVDSFVFIVSSIPFLLLFGAYLVVIFVVVKIVKSKSKKAKEKKAKMKTGSSPVEDNKT